MPPVTSLLSRTRPRARRLWPSPSRRLPARCTSLLCRKSTGSTYGTRGVRRKTTPGPVVGSHQLTIKAKARLNSHRNLTIATWARLKIIQCLLILQPMQLRQEWWCRIQDRDHLMHLDKIKAIKAPERTSSSKNTNQRLSRTPRKLKLNWNKMIPQTWTFI